jgi:hypothetical protein
MDDFEECVSTSYRRFVTGALAAGCAVVIAACGSSSKSSTNGPSQAPSLVKFSACMRSHGVPSFPDPSTGPEGPNAFGIDGYIFNLPADVNTQSPAYESADTICGKLLAGGGGGPSRNPALVAKARQAALAHARCMRAHGVPNFPDPTVSSNGNGITVGSGGPGMNPRSPAFQQAQKICNRANA